MMKILDLFCGAGGAAMGYSRAGFEVVGVDIAPQKHYPFEFIQADALDPPLFWDEFDVIHASPPCQGYSVLNKANKKNYPKLIEPIREILKNIGLPYIIENVLGAPLIDPLLLCGSMFNLGASGYQLRRHRLFETSFDIPQPLCNHQGYAIGVHGGGRWDNSKAKTRGGYQGTKAERAEAMGIDWMNRDELSNAIPPAYTQYIAEYLKGIL